MLLAVSPSCCPRAPLLSLRRALPLSLRRASALTTTFPLGLTARGATSEHYTASLDLRRPLLLRGSGDFMAAARADATERLPQGAGAAEVAASAGAHLAAAAALCDRFLSSGEVHGREGLRDALVHCFRQRGQLAVLLGGKSVGKSLLLGELARRGDLVGVDGARRAVLHVDARVCGADLAAGLCEALGEAAQGVLSSCLLQGQRRAQALGLPAPQSTALLSLEALLPLVADMFRSRGAYLCLVIDEANLALAVPPAPGAPPPPLPEQQRLLAGTRQLLERLVQLTKQSRAMNVLLVPSEHDFPHRLRRDNFFPTANLTGVFIASEVPPAKMRALLREGWGLGPRLSDVFLGFFGGHVHMASNALAKLCTRLDTFRVEELAPHGAAGAIARCLEGASQGGGGSGAAAAPEPAAMERMLQAMTARGFAPCAHEGDPCAQALSLANLGGLVTASATAPGLAEAVRGSEECGLVPSSHFLRHQIAKALLRKRSKGLKGRAKARQTAPAPLL